VEERVVDARVIALTNADLDELVKAGKFRQDLWFRLQGLSFDLRSLRDRKPDIMQLADSFLKSLLRRWLQNAALTSPSLSPTIPV
jgi:NtrC-family two-component system response regulator AlgB